MNKEIMIVLLLFNIGIASNRSDIFNEKMRSIENITGEKLPCKAKTGEVIYHCVDDNFKAIMDFYKLRLEK